jgi:hypothetical protein
MICHDDERMRSTKPRVGPPNLAPIVLAAFVTVLGGRTPLAHQTASVPVQTPTLEQAQHLFYSGNYEAASAIALTLRTAAPDYLATYELRTSALHFQLRRAMGNGEDKDKAFRECAACPALFEMFLEETRQGRAVAARLLAEQPGDPDLLFLLGKIDLNYVWLRLGTLGNRTGWHEYWEARRSLDAVLKTRPDHLRARVARAWIDYIVDTKMTPGFRWILGGGNKKGALATMRAAATGTGDTFAKTEAAFGLWDMEVRERNIPAAVAIARTLARDYPDNQELARFLATNSKK